MSIASEITRLQNAKASLKASINAKTDSSHQIANETIDDYATFVDSISTGGGVVEPAEKDVNFYDYDGTRLYSYTKTEFLALSSMPDNTEHSGLTCEGWNWSLQNAKNYVTLYGELDIGQTFITTDENTRIFIELDETTLEDVTICFSSSNGTINWGDGSAEETISGAIDVSHTYSVAGKYTITISGGFGIYAPSSGGINYFFKKGDRSNQSPSVDRRYIACVKEVQLGKVTSSTRGMFNNLPFSKINWNKQVTTAFFNLNQSIFGNSMIKCLVIPKYDNDLTNNMQSIFGASDVNIERIIFPDNWKITTLGSNFLSNNLKTTKVFLPNYSGLTTIGASAFNYCAIGKIIIPKSVNRIYAYALSSGFKYIDFRNHTAIPTINNNTLGTSYYSYAGTKIQVPSSLYKNWVKANYWSAAADYIYPYDANGNEVTRATVTLAVDSNISSPTTISGTTISRLLAGDTYTIISYSSVTTSIPEAELEWFDGTNTYDFDETITLTGSVTLTLRDKI